jgi:beta-lactam-binding protein with PASTA domain
VPSVFDISPLSDTVALDDQGNGETTFTVSNHPDRARRGRAYVVVEPPVDKSWFTIEDPEREFPVEGVKQVQQFTVKLKVPTDAPIKGSFKIGVASLRLPERSDEHFTLGPAIGFEVKAVEPIAKAPFPWWILVAGVLVLLIVGGLVTWALWPSSGVTVPDVVRQTQAEAERLLEEEGLVVGNVTGTSTPTEKPGTVIGTTPAAGEEVEEGSAVDLEVASNFVKVPDVVGKPGREAMKEIEAAGLKPNIVAKGTGTPGIVLDQNPRAGVEVAANDPVDLIVAQRLIPSVVGQRLASAVEILGKAGIRLGDVSVVDAGGKVVPSEVVKGRGGSLRFAVIVSQQPDAGTAAQPQQTVNVVVRMP